jgi:hypothetical protein
MEIRKMVIDRYDAKGWLFNNLITQSYFQGDLEMIRKT